MSQFIETMRIECGNLMGLNYHQARIDNTLNYFNATHHIDLKQLTCPSEFSHIDILKCRVLYDLNGILQTEFIPYAIKSISSVALTKINGNEYSFKYADRTWINYLLASSGADEIIMYDKEMIKDASYANLALNDGTKWLTPAKPLLKGTRREQLIHDNIIIPQDIYIDQLHHFTQVKFINAMMTWDESPTLEINNLSLVK